MVESDDRESATPAFYEVWDFETRNLINSFETEDAALVFLRRLFERPLHSGVLTEAGGCPMMTCEPSPRDTLLRIVNASQEPRADRA